MKIVALCLAGALAAACTMKEQEAPPLTGPSEFGTSVNVQVTPDVLQQDGASQSVVAVTVYNSVGQPAAGVPLRAEIRVNGQSVDFGALSARSIVSGADGRATLIYTAPSVQASVESLVDIAVTPIGSNYANAVARNATIRLVPTGTVQPPSGLNPAFTFSPGAPEKNQNVAFDASDSTGPRVDSITRYEWDFGDGSRGTGRFTTHVFSSPATYVVRLTVFDGLGRSASTSQSVAVGQGLGPKAVFTFSPTDPAPNTRVFFNAGESTPSTGATRIVSYRWDYGDGSPAGTGMQVDHTYTVASTYTVTLTVTDDLGRITVISKTVPVKLPSD